MYGKMGVIKNKVEVSPSVENKNLNEKSRQQLSRNILSENQTHSLVSHRGKENERGNQSPILCEGTKVSG